MPKPRRILVTNSCGLIGSGIRNREGVEEIARGWRSRRQVPVRA